jgi:hypothetical protein
MTLLRQVIDIPEEVHAGDYVLRLTEGVEHPDETISEYVVTPALARAFNRALGLLATAVTSGRSQAAFLHGSFGSGKSHFMAVLHALLGGNPQARGKPELAGTLARHDPVLQPRRFLRLTYHLIGADSLEEAVLGGYLRQIRRLHPDAPLPPVHRTAGLLANAARLREQFGDEQFFDGLNQDAGSGGGWAAFAGHWTPESYERAAAAVPDDPEHGRLASALVHAYFPDFTETSEFVDLDSGLAAVSEHASALGYDAVVLLLDELVLWLASRLPNQDFVSNEGAKVAKLVEAGDAQRPIPLVSFLARQRDLRDFLGQGGPGAQQAAIADTFRWWEDRFDKIVLGDENLPYVVEQRLLRPRDEQARLCLQAAFDGLDRRPEVWNTLLDGFNVSETHRGADQEAFRRTYPFSPALVSTVRAVSSVMQRERTALKVMQQILVDQRDELTVDDVVPVGDVFDYVVEGQTALTPDMERHFAAARRLYHEKLRPLLLREHRLDEEEAEQTGYRHPFRADDRIAKTLLLSALVPQVPALRELDARRLAALNHGTIVSPLPGEEATTVLARVKRWRTDVPEIQLTGDPLNPTISVRLVEVDYQGVLDRVLHQDSVWARRRLLRELVWQQLGIRHEESLLGVQEHPLVWRASRRIVEVAFGNVRDPRDLPDDLLVHGGERWRVVIDFPFDEEGRRRRDDLARVEALLGAHAVARTVVWLPRFFTQDRLDDLGRLVQLEFLLGGNGERFDQNADFLSATDRVQARAILETLRMSTRERLGDVLQQAYGAAASVPGDVEVGGDEDRVLVSLDPSFPVQSPVGATLEAAFGSLADQMLRHAYPAHPNFQPERPELRPGELRTVLGYVRRAHEQPNGRVPADQADRPALRRVCEPLGVGALYENVYVFDVGAGFPWRNRFAQQIGREGVGPAVPVGRLRAWTDAGEVRGLDRLTANLVIAAWAVVTDRVWCLGGVQLPEPVLEQITDDMELREQDLPEAAGWERAVDRVAALLDLDVNRYRTAANVATLAQRAREVARQRRGSATELVRLLEAHAVPLGISPSATTGRLATARAASRLLDDVEQVAGDTTLVNLVSAAELPADDHTVGRSLRLAAQLVDALSRTRWELLDALHALPRQDSQGILARLAEAGALDEFQTPLDAALRQAETAAVRLLARQPRTPVTPTPTSPGSGPELPDGPGDGAQGTLVLEADALAQGEAAQELDRRLRAFAAAHRGERVRVSWQAEP